MSQEILAEWTTLWNRSGRKSTLFSVDPRDVFLAAIPNQEEQNPCQWKPNAK